MNEDIASQHARSLTPGQVVVVIGAAVVLVGGVLVWFRIDLGAQVFSTAKLWFYDNYGFSEAWSTGLAVIAVALVVSNTSFIIAAVFFGWRKVQAIIVTIAAAVVAAGVFEYRSTDQCFHRRTGVPLCTLYKASDGSLVIRRTDGPAVPGAWQKIKPATPQDVARYGTTQEDRDRRKPKRLEIDSCGASTQFFDTETGEVLVYYVLREGAYEFFSGPGFHPVTSEPLRPVDKTAVAAICKSLAKKAELRGQVPPSHEGPQEAEGADVSRGLDSALVRCAARIGRDYDTCLSNNNEQHFPVGTSLSANRERATLAEDKRPAEEQAREVAEQRAERAVRQASELEHRNQIESPSQGQLSRRCSDLLRSCKKSACVGFRTVPESACVRNCGENYQWTIAGIKCVQKNCGLVSAELRSSGVPSETTVDPDRGIGPPGCIGIRSDMMGSQDGAECLLRFLGAGYHINPAACSQDGYAYNVRLK